jgi:hypothetical protein
VAHARGYRAAGGFTVVAVADLIPARRQKLIAELGPVKEYVDAMELTTRRLTRSAFVFRPIFIYRSPGRHSKRGNMSCWKPRRGLA